MRRQDTVRGCEPRDVAAKDQPSEPPDFNPLASWRSLFASSRLGVALQVIHPITPPGTAPTNQRNRIPRPTRCNRFESSIVRRRQTPMEADRYSPDNQSRMSKHSASLSAFIRAYPRLKILASARSTKNASPVSASNAAIPGSRP